MGSKSLAARGRLGAVSRRHPNQPDLIAAARSELVAAKIEDYVRAVVDAAPPLTLEARTRLAVLLLSPHVLTMPPDVRERPSCSPTRAPQNPTVTEESPAILPDLTVDILARRQWA